MGGVITCAKVVGSVGKEGGWEVKSYVALLVQVRLVILYTWAICVVQLSVQVYCSTKAP